MAKKGLGRGLNSLFDEKPSFLEDISEDNKKSDNDIVSLKINTIEPNRNQPRKNFDNDKLEVLSKSIKEHGVIQPIIVSKSGDVYTIVAGERRWRAAKKAGLTEIPAVIRNYTGKEIAQIALIENLQREDLNPIEEAIGYHTLINQFNMTQEDVSNQIGKSRSAIANSIRLLSLDKTIQDKLISGEITSGHARALLSLDDFDQRMILLQQIIERELNVRQSEALAKQLQKTKDQKQPKPVIDEQVKAQLDEIAHGLSSHFGTKVKLIHNDKRGKIEIEYFGNNDLERILNMLM